MTNDGGHNRPTTAVVASPAAAPTKLAEAGTIKSLSQQPGPRPGVTAGTVLIVAVAIVLAIVLRRRLLSKRAEQKPHADSGQSVSRPQPSPGREDIVELDERTLSNLDSLLKRGKPVTLRAFDPAPYRGLVPDALDHVWRNAGVSNWAGNSFQLVDPATYAAVVDDLLDGNRIIARDEVVPFGLTAFGQMSLWHRRFGVIKVDFPDGRIYFMRKPEAELTLQHKRGAILANIPTDVIGDFYDLLSPCLKKFGPIGEGEMYGFVPALALGGSADIQHVQKLRAPEHLSLLSQLSPPGTFFYDSGGTSIYGRYVPME